MQKLPQIENLDTPYLDKFTGGKRFLKNESLEVVRKLGNLSGLQIDSSKQDFFKQPMSRIEVFNIKTLKKAELNLNKAVTEQKEKELKLLAKLKKTKPKKVVLDENGEEIVLPPADKIYNLKLNQIIKSEKY